MAHFVLSEDGHYVNLDHVVVLVGDPTNVPIRRYQCRGPDGVDLGFVSKGEIDCALIEQERERMRGAA